VPRRLGRVLHPPLYETTKRVIDVVLGAALLVASLPLIFLAGLAVWLTTGQVPLLAQKRVGLHGREFSMLKLRTMDVHRAAEAETGEDVVAPKRPSDMRITAVGRVLRRTSIDELPQLVNVVLGQMSLVGPRPGLVSEVRRYPAAWAPRLSVMPGLSGLWQVSGRSSVGVRRWMAMDRYYASKRSLGLDLAILARTAFAVISMRGAW
jgi:lipopolysaccharide/colanic/teichoic acid biosynthesis glycosyltransferase